MAPTVALTLIYVLPVVASAMALDRSVGLATFGASVLAFDFFVIRPYFSLAIASPSGPWPASLLAATGASVNAMAGEARRALVRARLGLGRAVLESRPREEIVSAAAAALHQAFEAPAVIFMPSGPYGCVWRSAPAASR